MSNERTSASRWLTVTLLVGLSTTLQAEPPEVPLVHAAKIGDLGMVQALIADRADPTVGAIDGTTALHWAARLDDGETAAVLIGAGAGVDAANRYGVTPLILASTDGSAAMIGMLLAADADPNLASPNGETPLMLAARSGSAGAVRTLVAGGATVDTTEGWRGQTALMWAVAQNNPAASQALIDAGAYLHFRSEGGFTPLLFATREGNLDTLRVLVANGGNPDDALPTGMSALVLAVYNAHYDIAVELLEAGADPDADGQGWTALHQVTWTRRPNLGRNPPFPVPSGRLDALDMARALVQHGANVNARQIKEPRDGNRNLLRRAGATPFLLAAKSADVEMMRLLAELGADPMLTTDEGATPMMAAAGVGIWKIGENPGTNDEALAAVRLAWELDNDVNAADIKGNRALHGAAHRGADDIVRFLAEHDADLDAVNETGWTALSIAQGVFYPNTFNRHPSIVTLLGELGASPDAGTRRPEDLAPWEREAQAAVAVEPR